VRVADRRVETAAVLGFGVTGRAVTAFLRAHGVRVFVSDVRPLPETDRKRLSAEGVPCEETGHSPERIAAADLVVLSPGVRPDEPSVVAAQRRERLVLSELDLAYRVLPARSIVAVTGTNGKGTTVTLIGELLARSGHRVAVAGNVGRPFVACEEDAPRTDVFVLEVSSYQLEQSSAFHPQVAVLLNIAPDHLERHGTMAAYTAAKARLFRNQTAAETAVLPRELVGRLPDLAPRTVLIDDVHLPSWRFVDALAPHNRANLRAAIAACEAFDPGFDRAAIAADAIHRAICLPYRLQVLGEIDGVRVVNDSKATNPAATIAALAAMTRPVVLILGGRAKREGYEAFVEAVREHAVREVVLYGEAAPLLERLLGHAGGPPTHVRLRLDEAAALGVSLGRPGDVLLFSPACASFDQFDSYLERGEAFSEVVGRDFRLQRLHQGH